LSDLHGQNKKSETEGEQIRKTYSDGTSKTGSDEELEYTQIERFVDINDEDDDILDTSEAGARLVLSVARTRKVDLHEV
jgi:hypothetical protein